MDDELFNELKKLVSNIKESAKKGISKGDIKPSEITYFRWKVNKFKYTDEGITSSNAEGRYFTKKTWHDTTSKLDESVKKSKEYDSTLKKLNKDFGESDRLSNDLERFVGHLIYQFLEELKFVESDINLAIETFLKELHGEPIKHGAEVELKGITLRPEEIKIAFGVLLRQPKIEDLEREQHARTLSQPLLSDSSAILNLEVMETQGNKIQDQVGLAIAILRLFRVGSVIYTSYRMYSDSLLDPLAGGTLTAGQKDFALEKYLITEGDVSRLKKFWGRISNVLPRSLYVIGNTKTDFMTVAYNRYSDSLLQNGIIERRIANAIMGLEAIFLKANEKQELSYRLCIRIGKLLGFLGRDAHEIKDILKDGYKIRSTFAHGGHLDYKQKKKLDAKYKDVKNVLLFLLDYLRVSIVIMMLVDKEKDEVIDLIDDALIDGEKEKQLRLIVSNNCKDLVN